MRTVAPTRPSAAVAARCGWIGPATSGAPISPSCLPSGDLSCDQIAPATNPPTDPASGRVRLPGTVMQGMISGAMGSFARRVPAPRISNMPKETSFRTTDCSEVVSPAEAKVPNAAPTLPPCPARAHEPRSKLVSPLVARPDRKEKIGNAISIDGKGRCLAGTSIARLWRVPNDSASICTLSRPADRDSETHS